MSSVLIGIIGIALFMGIAIGSAIFLGPRFEEAQAQSLGSASLQAVSLVASGVNGFRMGTGWAYGPGLESVQTLVDAGFMRSVPVNPVLSDRQPELIDRNTQSYASASAAAKATWSPRYVFMSLGSDRATCTAIMRMTGQIQNGDDVTSSSSSPASAGEARMAGCFRSNANAGTMVQSGEYVVYARIGA